MSRKALDLTNSRFGRLVVLARAENDSRGNSQWNVVCECGVEKVVRGTSLQVGLTRSCGCILKERVRNNPPAVKHGYYRRPAGQNKSPLFAAFCVMKHRCDSPKSKDYPSYGGRGIKVCDRWLGPEGFTNFIADMGDKPTPKHSIDRIDNNGNYELRNSKGELQCRWATQKEQINNRRCSAKNKIKTTEQIAA